MKMKKWKYRGMSFLLLCLTLLPSFVVHGETEDAEAMPELSAKSAVVMDLGTGDVICSKAENEKLYPGGLTKIMTVLLMAENCDLTRTVSFSEIIYDLEEDSMKLELQPGEEITLYDAACAIMLSSANDVANGVAEYMAGSPEAFAAMMNDRAAELGCKNTHFSNPHGLYSEELYTSAYDFALISRAAYENETFREICRLTEYTIPATNLTDGPRQLTNYHQMLQEDSGYYQEWCLGGKSSYTSQGLNSIVTFGSDGKKNLVSVVLEVPEADAAYAETIDLLYYGFGDASDDKKNDGESEIQTLGVTGLEPISSSQEPGETGQEPGEGSSSQTEAVSSETDGTPQTATGTEENIAESGAEYVGEETEGTRKSENSIDAVLEQVEKYWNEGRVAASEYAKAHFEQVFALGCLFMLFLFLLILVLLRRAIRGSRSRRKRERTERILREKESMIDSLSLEELVEELHKRERLEAEMTGTRVKEKDADGIDPAGYPRGDE